MALTRVDEQPWWASLRHGGMLISPSRLAEAGSPKALDEGNGFPTSIAPMSDFAAGKLRADLAKSIAGGESLATLVTTLLESVCGLKAGRWDRNASAEWSRRVSTGDTVKPRRVWLGPNGTALPIFVDNEARLGIGRGRRSVTRVIEWLRGGDQRLALITNHAQWRIVYAGIDYDAWVESDSALWFEGGEPGPQLDALRILLSPEALTQPAELQPSPLMRAILDSRKGEAELSAELGERVRKAVERLIQGCAPALDNHAIGISTADIYRAACRMIMRLVVVLFAEARGLLPVDDRVYYESYSVGSLRADLQRHGDDRLRHRHSAWPRLLALFRLVHGGSPHERLPIPEYGGGLFRPGDPTSEDAILRAVALFERLDHVPDDARVADILGLVCVTRTRVRQGRSATWITTPVDFSDLSSEYIGILYEGLLDFELRRAEDTMLFLNIGDQPALPLTRLETMDDKALASLFEKMKKPKAGSSDGDSDGDGDDDAAEEVAEEESEEAVDVEELEEEPLADIEVDGRETARTRIFEWSRRAAVAGKLVAKPRGKKNVDGYDELLNKAARSLIARTVMPGEWFLVRWGGTRKGAGTFYTRPALAVPTVHRTLRPLAYQGPADETGPPALWSPRTPDEILALKVCDPAMGSGSFLVAALRYLTGALFEALCFHGWIRETDKGVEFQNPPEPIPAWLVETLKDMPSTVEDVRARLKRVVVERCLYGVDIDALAVELGRLALWVETMDKYLPFEFLDHKLKCGNALVGCWFDRFLEYPVMAWERDGGDKDHDKGAHAKGSWTKAIKDYRSGKVKSELVAAITPQISMESHFFDQAPDLVHDHALDVYRKIDEEHAGHAHERESVYDGLRADPHYRKLKTAFDVWCSIWFWPADDIENAPMPRGFLRLTDDEEKTLARIVDRQHFFHWELEYPDVFNAHRSGFDAVVGNPPWETLQPNSKEFFSNVDPLYKAYGKQEALRRQTEIFAASPDVEKSWLEYIAYYKSFSNWMTNVADPFGDPEAKAGEYSFSRSASENRSLHERWRNRRAKYLGYIGAGHPFQHQGEGKAYTQKLFLELGQALLREAGRMGFIVPSGVYTDSGSRAIRELFLDKSRWQWLFGFENRDKVFNIDERFKFCPIIVAKGGSTQAIKTAFMRRDVRDWEDAERHVLPYSRAQVDRFSPNTLAIVEIRSHRDAEVLAKIYANSVLLGDNGPNSWQIQYAQGDFNMTSDSNLFPPRPRWEADGYVPDEYSRWLKCRRIVDSAPDEAGWIRLRNGGWVAEDDIEDIALPLYEGRMIGQFDFSQKGWVSGKGRSAVWRDIAFDGKVIEPQYLMSIDDFYNTTDKDGNPKAVRGLKIGFMDVGSATNQRSMYASGIAYFPCGHKVPVLSATQDRSTSLAAILNSYVYDYNLRARFGGLSLNYFILAETGLPKVAGSKYVTRLCLSLLAPSNTFAPYWRIVKANNPWQRLWAVTQHERLRLRSMLDGVVAELYHLDFDDLTWILRDCDHPVEQVNNNVFARTLDPKGFWRVDKQRHPELRHTVLTLAAFADLKRAISACGGDRDAGIADFCNQNDGDGWMLPETLRLSDLGLGHDERARKPQPVRGVMGERFLPWQLAQTPEESWAECERHARNLLGEAGFAKLQAEIAASTNGATSFDDGHGPPTSTRESITLSTAPMLMDAPVDAVAGETDLFGIPVQRDLFGNVVEDKSRKGKR